MFPKSLGLTIPNKILRLFLPVILISCWLFLPLTALLWGLNKLIAFVLQKTDATISQSLGHRELSRVLTEGKDTGLLSDTQRRLAEGIFNCSDHLLKDYALPQPISTTITTAMKPEFVLEIAREFQLLVLPVYESEADSEISVPIGYVRTIDLEIAVRHQLDEQARQLLQLMQTELPLRSIVELSSRYSLLTGLIILQTKQDSFGYVADQHRRCLGFIRADQICDVLLGEGVRLSPGEIKYP